MAQAAPLRRATAVKKKMNDRSLLLSINEITHYFEKWTPEGGVLIKVKSTPKEQLFGKSSSSESHTWKCNYLQQLF